ncbi:MAG: tetratricopeptide repeat protein [Chitinispirillaceae bacterium]|nr:tetratricopeptide repeat protein [Chitinispirillaceae bacterium]
MIYVWQREYDKAIADFTQALRANPGYAMAYTNRGIAYMAVGADDLALRDFEKAITLDPADVTAMERLNQLTHGTQRRN